MAAVPLQLAFQGGGARLALFFPVIAALQQLESENVLKITRVAGSSAGAIAAALFAGKANVPALIEHCKGLRSKEATLRRVFPAPDLISWGGKAAAMYKIWNQQPFGDERALATLIDNAFSAAQIQAKTVGALAIPAFIASADLVSHRHREADRSASLTQSLVDSAALPFIFRMVGQVVDGGILNNLPIDSLRREDGISPISGDILAVGFEEGNYSSQITTPVELAMRLLEASINERTANAKALLGERRVLELPVRFNGEPVGSFDLSAFFSVCENEVLRQSLFDRAYQWFKDYAATKEKEDNELMGRLSSTTVSEVNNSAVISATQSSSLRKIAAAYAARSKFHLKRTILEVHAHSISSGDPGQDRFDYYDEFIVKDEPVFAYVSQLFLSNSGQITQQELQLYDGEGKVIPIVQFSVPDETGLHSRMLALFEQPIFPDNGVTTFTLHSKQLGGSSMRPLIDDGHDYLSIEVTQADAADLAEVRLFVPSEIAVNMQNGTVAVVTGLNIDCKDRLDDTETVKDGANFSDDADSRRSCPPGFTPYVWRAVKLKKRDVLRVVYSKA
jgi:predicted acylesterase/phospholipase RssA